jgi:hypothetical protein
MVHFEGLMRVVVRGHRSLVFSVKKNLEQFQWGGSEVDDAAVGG